MEQAGIQGRRRQVVGGAEGMKVPGEVQVHLLHGHHLGMSAPGGAPLDPEYRPKTRLAYGGYAGLAYVIEAHGEAEGGDRLALAKGGGGDGAHQHQLTCPSGPGLEQLETEFALVVALGAELVGLDGEAFGQCLDGETGGLAGDLDIA